MADKVTCIPADLWKPGMAAAGLFTHESDNRLLAALPSASLVLLQPHLSLVELNQRQILYRPEEPIGTVYFPQSGWCSMIAPLEDGAGAEVGLIGREGLVGIPVALGEAFDDLEAMVQCPGAAWSMTTDRLRMAMKQDPVLRTLLLRYVLVHHTQVTRTAACNGRHSIEQRLARWLLMAYDRANTSEFPMTHELLGMMLGVRRAGITVAAGVLQKAGLISYHAGQIIITDQAGLKAVACECYGITQRATERLFRESSSKDHRP